MSFDPDALRAASATIESLLPKHVAGLSLEHNEHHSNYQALEDYLEQLQLDVTEWAAPQERERCFALGSVWVAHWYPSTPVGFCRVVGATLPAVLAAAARRGRQ